MAVGCGRYPVAIIGCGFVFDIYMRTLSRHPQVEVRGVYDISYERKSAVEKTYDLPVYASLADLLADSSVRLVLNLTSIDSHFEVSRACIEAGKHVYSEKPLTTVKSESYELFRLAHKHSVRLSCAPCNVYSRGIRTLLSAVHRDAIGDVVLVEAELHDNPIHMANFQSVKSPSGAGWPLVDEVLAGCTHEHIAYHLVWICCMLGSAKSAVAFSSEVLPDKLGPDTGLCGTADYSVLTMGFSGGAAARVTCGVVAPRDHRIKVVGTRGQLTLSGYRMFNEAPMLEVFSSKTLNARKFKSVVGNPVLEKLLGVSGSPLPLLGKPQIGSANRASEDKKSALQAMKHWLRRREVYDQDKWLGVIELINAISKGEDTYLSADFHLHINELTLFAQSSGERGASLEPNFHFEPLPAPPEIAS